MFGHGLQGLLIDWSRLFLFLVIVAGIVCHSAVSTLENDNIWEKDIETRLKYC